MSSIRILRTFIAIARYGSFANAAEHVALTQAAVGLQMRQLEDEFRQTLFDRSGRAVSLNAYGRALLPRVERLVEEYDALAAPDDVQDGMTGVVTFGAIVSMIGATATLVAALKMRHPNLEVRLQGGKTQELITRLEASDIDVAIVAKPHIKPSASVKWLSIHEEPLMLLVHNTLAEIPPLTLLATHPYLRFDRSQRTGMLIENALGRQRVHVNVFLELNSLEGIAELVRQRVGIGIVPLLRHASWTNDSALAFLPLPVPAPPREIGMLVRSKSVRTSLIKQIHEELLSTW
jgi:DNA-binding transcriptional LysR family regulator